MRVRSLPLAAAAGAALLTAGLLPATAAGTPGPALVRRSAVGAADLLAEVRDCVRVSRGEYRTDAHTRPSVPVCGTDDIVFWKADMDIDCDGRRTSRCNPTTDPWFLPDTAFRQSDGRALRSDRLPHVVVPAPSRLWDHARSGIGGGTVAAVIHDGRVRYGVVGDAGPAGVIGEASYAMAKSLGIDPDPRTGGAASGVTYILFRDARVKPIEDRSAAVSLGERLARELVADD
ncbi:glycoside hydrolase family 75 protein [Streptomyces sp. DH24]|uniref:glycoside hydrolase family 75 protein n=1 Tax=Streptomyces sp. DH24 TaxID=3040123 RepID=UPI002441F107|nr:glycoside hydrolase family 75 protein [Streptomyces sp. DH24]MDG9715811.1 glycoside hydrolase family 75 protein [Streptomyces sp. DH24]